MATVDESVETVLAPVDAWWLVSTGEGLSRWFVPARVVPGPTGSLTLTYLPGARTTMLVAAWQPPSRVRYGAAVGEVGRAYELRVRPSPAGGSVVRVIDSGMPESDLTLTRAGWRSSLRALAREAARLRQAGC
jgi:hypothetical protein